MRPGRDPAELFGLVEHYESLGIHRTGSVVDDVTARWFVDELAATGLAVHTEPVPFDRWECDVSVHVGDSTVECLAVPYEWTGDIDTTNVAVVDLEQGLGTDISVIAPHVRRAREASYEAAVFATRHPKGALVGINRPLSSAPVDFPVFLVAGSQLGALRSSTVRVVATARVEPGTATNVVGTTAGSGPRIMLTTPLNGWFTCAGERGSGIAVLFDLIARLAGEHELLVVATGGHELGYFGAHEWLAAQRRLQSPLLAEIGSVIHIGASIAVESKPGTLTPIRRALTTVDASSIGTLREALAPIGLDPVPSSTSWTGESEIWCELGLPMLSFSGAGVDFHTPLDLAASVTSPGALSRVADAVAQATLALNSYAR